MIPVYVFYSMFGFQRTGDLMWAMGDQMGRGFLLGATAGRTTLNGEGLQHEDGQSQLLASTNPACVAYDPAWAYEIAIIVQDALRRMTGEDNEDVFYYLTVYNEPKKQPAAPDVADLHEGVLKGIYRYAPAPEVSTGNGEPPRAQILASGTGIHWALEAQQLLADDWGVAADVWSVTSWNELRRDAMRCDEYNLLHPGGEHRTPYVTRALDGAPGPVVAVSDWMRAVQDQIAPWVPQPWLSLGTDGYGRSDTRPALRRYFHVDGPSVTLAVLSRLADAGEVKADVLDEAVRRYQLLDPSAAPEEEPTETAQDLAPGG
jgi:pyruvate dehydrogenase E1 component